MITGAATGDRCAGESGSPGGRTGAKTRNAASTDGTV